MILLHRGMVHFLLELRPVLKSGLDNNISGFFKHRLQLKCSFCVTVQIYFNLQAISLKAITRIFIESNKLKFSRT